jgi:hypothetical protein
MGKPGTLSCFPVQNITPSKYRSASPVFTGIQEGWKIVEDIITLSFFGND